METDIVKELGYLTLGSRLKRIAETLQSSVQDLMDERGLGFQAGQFPLLAAVERSGELTIGQLVKALGVAQPGVTRNVKQLVAAGLLQVTMSQVDARAKVVSLTPKSKAIVAEARSTLWVAIETALAEICKDHTADLLGNLENLEHQLNRRSLAERSDQHMRQGAH